MTRSQNGALLLSCAALSSATPCRFIPALSLITLSARASTSGGIVRPICFAALRLMTNSNFVGCSTGKSAGLAPFKILSTYSGGAPEQAEQGLRQLGYFPA